MNKVYINKEVFSENFKKENVFNYFDKEKEMNLEFLLVHDAMKLNFFDISNIFNINDARLSDFANLHLS